MVRVTAQAVTGVDGRRIHNGFDPSDLRPQLSGERITGWEREVSYQGSATLREVLEDDRWIKYNLLANIVAQDEKVPLEKEVGLYCSGSVKELRLKKKQFRLFGKTYLGKR